MEISYSYFHMKFVRGYVQKPCRHHGYFGKKDCYYCYRRKLINQYGQNPHSPEEQLLMIIFGMDKGRFYQKRIATPRKAETSSRPNLKLPSFR